MDLVSLIVWLAIGGVAGWIAGNVMRGGSFGLLGNIVVGIVGAALAGIVLPSLGIVIGGGILGAVLNAAIGACMLLFVIRLVAS